MKCNHDDCFTCPYPDCIADESDGPKRAYHRQEEKLSKSEYYKKYYEEHREELLAKHRDKWKKGIYKKKRG